MKQNLLVQFVVPVQGEIRHALVNVWNIDLSTSQSTPENFHRMTSHTFFWRNPLTFLCCGRICHDVCRFHCFINTVVFYFVFIPLIFSTQYYAAFRSHATDLGRGWQCLLFASQSYKNVMSIRLWAGFQLKTDFMGMIQSPEDASKHADIGDT